MLSGGVRPPVRLHRRRTHHRGCRSGPVGRSHGNHHPQLHHDRQRCRHPALDGEPADTGDWVPPHQPDARLRVPVHGRLAQRQLQYRRPGRGGTTPPTGGTVFGGTDNNDINAAIFNVFAAHNHMHDWAYNLGFTAATHNLEQSGGDQVVGSAQAGATQGAPTFAGRDASDAVTPADGTPVQAQTYLWQPIAGAFYPQCTDGSFDMSLMAHQYGHAIANRMVGGPATGLTSAADGQARAIGEGFSDLAAVEYLHEYGYAPADNEDPFTIGAYVTGNGQRGVRNYSMAQSPLNYSNVQGYDGSGGASPQDDGEIWAAVNHDIRQALLAKYPPSSSSAAAECADGRLAASSCPGNRRWMQLAFDALLLMPSGASMVQARDAMLAADAARFGGANQPELWTAFARRGLGQGAVSDGSDDADPAPGFASPLRADESTLSFKPTAAEEPGSPAVDAELFVGDHEAGATPVTDIDPSTPLDDKVDVVPGSYAFTVRADGYGAQKLQRTIPATPMWRSVSRCPPTGRPRTRARRLRGRGPTATS